MTPEKSPEPTVTEPEEKENVTKQPSQVETAVEIEQQKPKHYHLDEIQDAIKVNGVYAEEQDLEWTDLMLSPSLLRGVQHKGFIKPSRIQQIALPLITNSSTNLIAQAKNGSGKTATFSLALLSCVNENMPAIQGVCLCPTRELAVQNVQVLAQLGKFTRIKYFIGVPQCVPYGRGEEYHIYVGTPGKTLEFIRKRTIDFQNTRMIVLDEADELVNPDNNMGPQVMQFRLSFRHPVQILLFSATFSEEVQKFAQRMAPDANMIQVKRQQLTLDCIQQHYMVCSDDDDKFNKLCELYASMIIGQSVIFVNSRNTAFDVSLKMREQGHAVSLLCGSMSKQAGSNSMGPEIRDRIMREFKDGETKVLICTDVLARGIDVPQVTLVVNYELPFLYSGSARFSRDRKIAMETYLHRIGRTGRFGAKGMAINMINPNEMYLIDSIKEYYECNIEPLECDPESIEDLLRNIRS
ncbi:DEAD/DEAH box helicase, putative [Babesia bigemina]|uniref:RNA helicase n=1 Tax=Babesia bigemina TaxID=5866 RepID=A0A061DE15_BABBI|nr:DEAD/DEAH box helicase, putative [Babesia bigemina]CDR97874.1 DEAD/DEAH box helicase, putative [Babesia bigemina]|eukprot:XP_012770060.1 DEAD/DEAH box helicase, putative [Babesia bigemina]